MKLLVSACLLGEPVRYDGKANDSKVASVQQTINQWQQRGLIVPVCPELMGGLPTPRPAAEITGGNGAAVLAGAARIITNDQQDVTDAFVEGAQRALDTARQHGAVAALLASRSPSCGSDSTYDGSFSGTLTPYQGATAALLTANGIPCFPPERFDELKQWFEAKLTDA